MRSRATGSDKISPRCVPRRSTMAKCSRSAPPQHLAVAGLRPDALLARLAVAIFSRGAFPGVLPWQDSAAVRSRASIRGKFCAPCIPKAASDGKIASSRQDSRAMHPKTGWLWQDMRAMHPKSPANRLSGTHRAKILPGRGRLSLHGPLESRTARESCHPASTKRPSARNPCAADQRQTARAPATPAPPNSASRQS